MTASHPQTVLLHDAIDRVVLDPCASYRWHALASLFNSNPSPQVRTFLAATLLGRVSGEGVAGFLRATFLASLTGERSYLDQAGRMLQDIRPIDADRLMAFATYQWGWAVMHSSGHEDFSALLRTAQLPGIMRLLGEQLDVAPLVPRAPRTPGLRKIALIVPFVGDAFHTPTQMALEQARLLIAQGLEVKLFSCQEMLQPHMTQYLGWTGTITNAAPERAELSARLPADVQVMLSDPRLSFMRRWQIMLAAVHEFAPDLVMFVGLNSPLVFPLYAKYPVLGLNVHALAPMAPVDVWLAADPARAGHDDTEWGAALPPAHGYHHPFRVKLKPVSAPVARAELGITDGQVVMVTAGARLPHEIDGPWAQIMLDVMARNPNAVWLLVGGVGTVPPALAAARPGQVRTLAQSNDLRSIYRCCDLFVNPPRIGGGFSVAEAMGEGLPVLALAGSDAGSKLGGDAMADEASFFAMLEAMLSSPELRSTTGAEMRRRFTQTLDLESSGPSLRAACELALARFRQRYS